VENKTLALRGDAVHETTAIRASDQISISIERQHADVSFVTLEKDRSIPRSCDPENLATIAGGNIKIAGCVEHEIPDVLCFWIEIYGSGELARGVILLRSRFGDVGSRVRAALETIDFAIRIRSRVNHTFFVYNDRLHLQFLGLEYRRVLSVRRNPVNARWPAGRVVNAATRIRGDRPDVGGRRR